jgi:hypothetical protein
MTVPTWDGRNRTLGGRRMSVKEMTSWWNAATPAMRAAARADDARTRPAPRSTGASRASRQAALRKRARALLLAADDTWKVYFKARGKLTRLENERSRMGFELFGDPTAFR